MGEWVAAWRSTSNGYPMIQVEPHEARGRERCHATRGAAALAMATNTLWVLFRPKRELLPHSVMGGLR